MDEGRNSVPPRWTFTDVRGGAARTTAATVTAEAGPAERGGESPEPGSPEAVGFRVEQPVRTFGDLVLAEVVRRRVDTALNLVAHRDVLFGEWNLAAISPHRGGAVVSLYGPPGTGKPACAEAIAHRLGRPYLRVGYAQIESRYVGETPKNIVRCFAEARRSDAVLIFDEADSILGRRLSRVTQSADHSVNVSRSVMLTELDHFDGVVVFTTNFPENYDAAFVRRILAHIRLELPDLAARRDLWTRLLPKELPLHPEVTADILAAESEGMAGGDIVNVVMGAAAAAVARRGERRVVELADLRGELAATAQARREVGNPPASPRLVAWEDAPRSGSGAGEGGGQKG
ncbi:ATP-binding protein [Streptomyces sp. NBRC 110028]|uniref:ATP-binding protein n=1 Tax=Streptomyces sp. NBRC 110028 TaxID=1621260 RepID=UPI0006E1540C|nr:ATP-binding protein [Streptomyces sp. NBRC 110028]